MIKMFGIKSTAIFAGGVLLGTAGLKLLWSKEAKRLKEEQEAAVIADEQGADS